MNNNIAQKCYEICFKIYIARNITLNSDDLCTQLKEIDILLKDSDNYN